MLDNKIGKVVMVFQLYVLINPWFRNLETDERIDQDYRSIKYYIETQNVLSFGANSYYKTTFTITGFMNLKCFN